MTTITAVVDGLAEVAPVEQAVAPRFIGTDRTASPRRAGRGRDAAILVSIGVAEAVWFAALGYAIWALIF